MKKIMGILLVLGLIHNFPVWAEDGGEHHHKDKGHNAPEKVQKPAKVQVKKQPPRPQEHAHPGRAATSHQRPQGAMGHANSRPTHMNGRVENKGRTMEVNPKLRKMGFKRAPEPIRDRTKILVVSRERSVIHYPVAGPHGVDLHVRAFEPRQMTTVTIRNHMAKIAVRGAFGAQVIGFNRSEAVPNHYYWHTWNGMNYCHYYDPWGYHWYGWYMGSGYFWTRYYANNWWWYDSAMARWCYWNNGGWWWQDPTLNTVYVYDNGAYVPAEATDTTDTEAVNGSVPPAAEVGSEKSYQSKDSTRIVKVEGNSQDAFLYDTADPPAFEPHYLDTGVSKVKFSYDENGKLSQIMLISQDGSFHLYDTDGNPYQAGAASEPPQ